MEIKTKFNIGDKVFVVFDSKIYEGVVSQIKTEKYSRINLKEEFPKSIDDYDYEPGFQAIVCFVDYYSTDECIKKTLPTCFYEKNLFCTRQELIDSLLKNA